jgi:hypothetical protein
VRRGGDRRREVGVGQGIEGEGRWKQVERRRWKGDGEEVIVWRERTEEGDGKEKGERGKKEGLKRRERSIMVLFSPLG